jgi:hypothetical protein
MSGSGSIIRRSHVMSNWARTRRCCRPSLVEIGPHEVMFGAVVPPRSSMTSIRVSVAVIRGDGDGVHPSRPMFQLLGPTIR